MMKLVRSVSFVSAAAVLLGLVYGTLSQIFGFFGFVDGISVIFEHPIVLAQGFYQNLGSLGVTFDLVGWYAPWVIVVLLFAILANTVDALR